MNTVNTKVDLRFKLAEADWIPEKTKEKLLNGVSVFVILHSLIIWWIFQLQNKITKEGYYVIKSDLTRSQQMNLADALEKLRTLIRGFEFEAPAATEETLEKIRKR